MKIDARTKSTIDNFFTQNIKQNCNSAVKALYRLENQDDMQFCVLLEQDSYEVRKSLLNLLFDFKDYNLCDMNDIKLQMFNEMCAESLDFSHYEQLI